MFLHGRIAILKSKYMELYIAINNKHVQRTTVILHEYTSNRFQAAGWQSVSQHSQQTTESYINVQTPKRFITVDVTSCKTISPNVTDE